MSGKTELPLGAGLALSGRDQRVFQTMLGKRSVPYSILSDLFLMVWYDIADDVARLNITHRKPGRMKPASYILPDNQETTRPTREQLEFIADDLAARLLLMGANEKDQS